MEQDGAQKRLCYQKVGFQPVQEGAQGEQFSSRVRKLAAAAFLVGRF
jgi:hypothetical protein